MDPTPKFTVLLSTIHHSPLDQNFTSWYRYGQLRRKNVAVLRFRKLWKRKIWRILNSEVQVSRVTKINLCFVGWKNTDSCGSFLAIEESPTSWEANNKALPEEIFSKCLISLVKRLQGCRNWRLKGSRLGSP